MLKSGSSGEPGLFDSGYTGSVGMTVSVRHASIVEVGASIMQMLFFQSTSSQLYQGMYLDSRWRERLIEVPNKVVK